MPRKGKYVSIGRLHFEGQQTQRVVPPANVAAEAAQRREVEGREDRLTSALRAVNGYPAPGRSALDQQRRSG